ncbi:GNAT family N-acetyltransferase [Micromonospora sp. NPDC049523]|uniref:GNAT family N-acetyltransferase n=1 Tax=Micromonospora sp. NPDC049523 TaxID=3155921 RepID=UPI00341BDDC5
MTSRVRGAGRHPGMNLPAVVRAKWAERDVATSVLAEAFRDEPLAAWLVPDQRWRSAVLSGSLRILVEYALLWGDIDLLDDQSAVAVWIRRYRPLPPPRNFDRQLAAACGDHLDRFTQLTRLLDARRPNESHYHLAALAVRPGARNTGCGSTLLRHHHTRLDQLGVPAYVEATSTAVRDFYTRHGYRPDQPIRLPGGGEIHPMRRPARHALTRTSAPQG